MGHRPIIERGFLLDGDVFMPGMNTMARGPYATLWHGLRAAKSRENVDRGVYVAIMMSSALGGAANANGILLIPRQAARKKVRRVDIFLVYRG